MANFYRLIYFPVFLLYKFSGHMCDGNGRTSFKVLVEFEASSHVSISLSPDGRWLAYGDEGSGSVFIGKWRNHSLHLSDVQEGPEMANVRILEWSPDSKRLLAVSDTTVALLEPNNAGSASFYFKELEDIGIACCFWSYDSSFVIANDSCSISTAVCGVDFVVHWLPGVRMVDDRPLLALRPDSKTLALWTSQDEGGECLIVYSCADWSLLLIIRPKCVLLSGISWFPNSRALVVWDSIARNYVEFFHPDGSTKHVYTSADLTDEGVQTVAVSPCSSLIAILKGNLTILVYNTLIWRHVSLFDIGKDTKIAVGCQWTPFIRWSICGEYLASSSSASTQVVIWSKSQGDSFNFSFGNKDLITDMTWHPKKPTLAVATGSQEVHLLKCPKFEMKNPQKEIECCKLSNGSIPVRELRWVGVNPYFLLVRSKSSHVAVTCIR